VLHSRNAVEINLDILYRSYIDYRSGKAFSAINVCCKERLTMLSAAVELAFIILLVSCVISLWT